MKLMKQSLILLVALGFTGVSFAAETTDSKSKSKMKIEDLKKEKKGEDIDEEITNARMRANAGSKSKYSMSLSLGYSMGSIAKPLSKERPDIYGSVDKGEVNLGGSVSARYRMDKSQSLSFGTGVSVIQPFDKPSKRLKHEDYGDKTEVSNPYLNYNYAGKMAGLQTISSVGVNATTSPRYTKWGDVGGISGSFTMLKGFKESKWQLGLSTSLGYTHYTKDENDSVTLKNEDGSVANVVQATDGQRDWSAGLYPFAEYPFSDMFSFRTVVGIFGGSFYHNKTETMDVIRRTRRYQSIGLGIAATRNVYIYPNFQFSLENIIKSANNREAINGPDPKFTNIAVSATINMF